MQIWVLLHVCKKSVSTTSTFEFDIQRTVHHDIFL